jgi:hypothetical protein
MTAEIGATIFLIVVGLIGYISGKSLENEEKEKKNQGNAK